MKYKEGDKVVLTEAFRSFWDIVDPYFELRRHCEADEWDTNAWWASDPRGVKWVLADDDIIGLYGSVSIKRKTSRKRKPISLWYRMAIKEGEE